MTDATSDSQGIIANVEENAKDGNVGAKILTSMCYKIKDNNGVIYNKASLADLVLSILAFVLGWAIFASSVVIHDSMDKSTLWTSAETPSPSPAPNMTNVTNSSASIGIKSDSRMAFYVVVIQIIVMTIYVGFSVWGYFDRLLFEKEEGKHAIHPLVVMAGKRACVILTIFTTSFLFATQHEEEDMNSIAKWKEEDKESNAAYFWSFFLALILFVLDGVSTIFRAGFWQVVHDESQKVIFSFSQTLLALAALGAAFWYNAINDNFYEVWGWLLVALIGFLVVGVVKSFVRLIYKNFKQDGGITVWAVLVEVTEDVVVGHVLCGIALIYCGFQTGSDFGNEKDEMKAFSKLIFVAVMIIAAALVSTLSYYAPGEYVSLPLDNLDDVPEKFLNESLYVKFGRLILAAMPLGIFFSMLNESNTSFAEFLSHLSMAIALLVGLVEVLSVGLKEDRILERFNGVSGLLLLTTGMLVAQEQKTFAVVSVTLAAVWHVYKNGLQGIKLAEGEDEEPEERIWSQEIPAVCLLLASTVFQGLVAFDGTVKSEWTWSFTLKLIHTVAGAVALGALAVSTVPKWKDAAQKYLMGLRYVIRPGVSLIVILMDAVVLSQDMLERDSTWLLISLILYILYNFAGTGRL